MKNLSATLGVLMIIIAFMFFQGKPMHDVQAAPLDDQTLVAPDTFPPPSAGDTSTPKHMKKKEWKKRDTTRRHDTLI
ncbi:hypothetical protein [Chitinophaga vietnamensis]|uniref:hypothetical protein n=1 Tax=Chitinophaga vietnamensis TaxID=2593957 RepID=UPI0011779016|nr:hypothetical protein [Chitinophaga vietnamensis]